MMAKKSCYTHRASFTDFQKLVTIYKYINAHFTWHEAFGQMRKTTIDDLDLRCINFLSKRTCNINNCMVLLDKPLQKAVVYLDEIEFKSTWLGNKAIYRTRMAIQDGGELVVLAPGVDKFGEDKAVDLLIRKYGYRGREYVLDTLKTAPDLAENLSAAAHLIHGSSDGRFKITYCTRHLSQQEVKGVGFAYLPYEEALKRYPKNKLESGVNTLPDGEEIYYISNPALGLWIAKERLN